MRGQSPWAVHARLPVNEVATGQVFLQVLYFSPVNNVIHSHLLCGAGTTGPICGHSTKGLALTVT